MKSSAILSVLSALLLLTACNVQKREIAKLQVYSIRYPAEFKILANTIDPCFTGVAKSDTVIKIGKADTVNLPGSTVITHVKDTVIKTITLPGKKITQPVYTTIHDTVTNDRALQACQSVQKGISDSLVVVKTQLVSTKGNLNIWRWIAICAGALILIFIVVKVYAFFSGGAAASAIKKVV